MLAIGRSENRFYAMEVLSVRGLAGFKEARRAWAARSRHDVRQPTPLHQPLSRYRLDAGIRVAGEWMSSRPSRHVMSRELRKRVPGFSTRRLGGFSTRRKADRQTTDVRALQLAVPNVLASAPSPSPPPEASVTEPVITDESQPSLSTGQAIPNHEKQHWWDDLECVAVHAAGQLETAVASAAASVGVWSESVAHWSAHAGHWVHTMDTHQWSAHADRWIHAMDPREWRAQASQWIDTMTDLSHKETQAALDGPAPSAADGDGSGTDGESFSSTPRQESTDRPKYELTPDAPAAASGTSAVVGEVAAATATGVATAGRHAPSATAAARKGTRSTEAAARLEAIRARRAETREQSASADAAERARRGEAAERAKRVQAAAQLSKQALAAHPAPAQAAAPAAVGGERGSIHQSSTPSASHSGESQPPAATGQAEMQAEMRRQQQQADFWEELEAKRASLRVAGGPDTASGSSTAVGQTASPAAVPGSSATAVEAWQRAATSAAPPQQDKLASFLSVVNHAAQRAAADPEAAARERAAVEEKAAEKRAEWQRVKAQIADQAAATHPRQAAVDDLDQNWVGPHLVPAPKDAFEAFAAVVQQAAQKFENERSTQDRPSAAAGGDASP